MVYRAIKKLNEIYISEGKMTLLRDASSPLFCKRLVIIPLKLTLSTKGDICLLDVSDFGVGGRKRFLACVRILTVRELVSQKDPDILTDF